MTTREQKLEDAIVEAIINIDRMPALSGYSDAVIYATEDIITRLKNAVRKNAPVYPKGGAS